MLAPMATESENLNRAASTETDSSKTDSLDWAVLGCLVAGGVGIVKAFSMERGIDVFACILGSLVAFSVVFYVYLRKQ